MARRIVVEFLGEDKSLSRTAAQADNNTSKLGSTLKRVGKVAALGLAAGAVVAGKALFDMTKNAIEDDAAQRKLAVALKNSVGATDQQVAAVERWISAQGRALGVTDDELRPAFQRLVQATGSVKEAQRQMGIAMDVSAGTGKSLKVVTEALMKANNGTTASLSKLGLKTKDAEGNTLSLDQALKSMADTFEGQAAAKANTLEGKMDRLKLVFDETKESIGSKLIPVLTDLATWFLEDGLPAAEQLWATFNQKVVPVLRDFGSVVQSVGGFLLAHKEAVAGLTGALVALVAITKVHAAVLAVQAAGGLLAFLQGTKLVTAATKAWAAVQWVMNAALSANPIGIVVMALAALGVAVVVAYKKSETFRRIVDGALRAIGKAGKWMWDNALKPAFTAMQAAIKAIGTVGRWLWNQVFQPVFRLIVDGIGKLLRHWGDMLRALGKVPGFGWADAAGRKLQAAGDKAERLARGIRDIPERKDVYVNIHKTTINSVINKQANDPRLAGANARGTSYWRGGATWVGEEGPELMWLPRGTRVMDAAHSEQLARRSHPGADAVVGHAVVDLRLDGRTVQRVLLKLKRTTGESLGLA